MQMRGTEMKKDNLQYHSLSIMMLHEATKNESGPQQQAISSGRITNEPLNLH